QVGDKVEYRPVGGAEDNVSHSTGEIVDIVEADGQSAYGNVVMPYSHSRPAQETRYAIKNDNTGKTTNYLVGNLL
ncbi:hypothetical protein GLOTRDRAFT_18905, partial [Gloeophyllum trabeum ATCC 11539]